MLQMFTTTAFRFAGWTIALMILAALQFNAPAQAERIKDLGTLAGACASTS